MTSFKNYAEQFFESVEKLYVTIPGVEDGFGKDFLQIKKKADELKQDPTFACKSGQADENRKKNRYKDILPFDFARVKFTNYHGGSDYINASYIKRGKDAHCYIAAQGPLPHTVNDFWNMVWCCQVKVVVMVCKEIEMGRRKCERYWADEEERCKTFGEFTIEFMSSRQDNKDFLVRTLVVKFRNEKRTVIQFHYTAWPDHGVPKARASILQMIMEARREQSYETDTKQPLCIHCSAGCGRTGAVLVIDYFRHLLSIDRLEGTVFNVVMDMRRQRSSVVQTKEQYEFVHLAVVELLTNHIKDKQINCPENSVSRSVSNAHNYVNVQIQPDNRKHTSLAPIKASATPEVKPRSSQYYGGGHLKSQSDTPPGKPSRNPADSRTAPGSRVTSFDSADGKSRPAVAVYNKPQANKIPPPKPSLVKRASSDSGPIPAGTPPSMMAQQKGATFGYLNHGGYSKNADKYGKDSSQESTCSVPTAMTAAEKTSAAAANALPTSKKPQPVKPKRSVRAASSTTYAAQQQQQQQQQRSVPEARRRRGVSHQQQQHDTSSKNGWNSLQNQHHQQQPGRPLSSALDYSKLDATENSSFLVPAMSQHHLLQPHTMGYGNSGGGRGTRSTVVSVSDKPAEYETVVLDLPPKLPERTPESYRIVSEDEDDGVLEVGKGGGGGGGQIARYESLHVNPTTTSPARNQQPPPPPSSQQQQNPSSIYATVTDVAPPVPPQSAPPPLPVSAAPSVSTGGSLIPNTVTAPFKELASKFKNFAPSSLTGALTADSQSKSMATLAKFSTPPNMATSIGIEQDMNFGNRYRRKPVGPRKQPEQWSSSKLL